MVANARDRFLKKHNFTIVQWWMKCTDALAGYCEQLSYFNGTIGDAVG
jgi:hypothetical protein